MTLLDLWNLLWKKVLGFIMFHLVSPVHAFLVTCLDYFSVCKLKYLLHQYMHCLIVNHFNQKTPEKTVNRMSLVVLDIECIENNIVKELWVYKDGQTVEYSFIPPKKFKPTSQSSWCTKHLDGIIWSSGYEKYTELEKILKNLEATETEFFAKGYEKCKFLSDFLETKIINLDDYDWPKVQFLIFKDEQYDWRCSNYPFRHAETLHCAERKAFAYGTWYYCTYGTPPTIPNLPQSQ